MSNIHLSHLPHFLLEWEMYQKFKRKSNIIVFSNFFHLENTTVYEKMWKNIVERGRPQMTPWLLRIACWIPKVTNTHPQFVQ